MYYPRNAFGLSDTGTFTSISVGDGTSPATIDANLEDVQCQTLRLSTGAVVNAITTAIGTSSDTKLCTEKAIQSYVAGSAPSVTVQDPLYFPIAGTIGCYPASDIKGGYVTVTDQTLAGKKTFISGIAPSTLTLGSVTATAIEDQYPPSGSHTTIPTTFEMSATVNMAISEQGIYVGGVKIAENESLNTFTIYTNNAPSVIVAPTQTKIVGSNPQLVLQDSGGAAFALGVTPTGTGMLNASGAGVAVDATDTLSVLNTAGATSLTSGALVCSGGAAFASDVWSRTLSCLSATTPQLTLYYDLANFVQISCTSGGDLLVNSSGNDFTLHVSDRLNVRNNSAATGPGTGALIVTGGGSFGQSSWFSDGLTSTSVVSPFVRTNLDNTPLLLFAGNGPNYQASKGAAVNVQDSASGGNLDLSASAGSNIRFYTGSTPPLTLAVAVKPAGIDFGLALLSHFYNTTQATSTTAASVVIDGGLAVGMDLRCGGTIYGNISGAFTPSVPLILQGAAPQLQLKSADGLQTANVGVSAAGVLSLSSTSGQEIQTGANNPLHVLSSTAANGSNQGALIVAGGIGCAGNLFSGAVVYGQRCYFSYAQDQGSFVNSVTGDVGYVSTDTTGNMGLRTTSGKQVFVPSTNTFRVWSNLVNALQVVGGIQAAGIQFTQPVYREIDISPAGVPDPLASPTFTQYGAFANWAFPHSPDTGMFFTLQLPEDFTPNTTCIFKLHWMTPTAPGGSVAAYVGISTQFLSEGNNSLSQAATTTTITMPVPANLVTYVTTLQTVTPANMVAGDYCTLRARFQRVSSLPNSTDTFAGAIHLLGLTCRYQSSGVGKTW